MVVVKQSNCSAHTCTCTSHCSGKIPFPLPSSMYIHVHAISSHTHTHAHTRTHTHTDPVPDTPPISTHHQLTFGTPISSSGQVVLLQIITHVESFVSYEGIFRKSGSKNRVDQLVHDLGEKDFEQILLSEVYKPHDYATMLKQYFSDLPEPLLLKRHLNAYIQTAGDPCSNHSYHPFCSIILHDMYKLYCKCVCYIPTCMYRSPLTSCNHKEPAAADALAPTLQPHCGPAPAPAALSGSFLRTQQDGRPQLGPRICTHSLSSREYERTGTGIPVIHYTVYTFCDAVCDFYRTVFQLKH